MALSIGFTVKSGWAAAVLISVSGDSLRVIDSRRVELSDPKQPDAKQPYHDGFATARTGPSLMRLVKSVKGFGGKSVRRLLKEYSAHGKIAGAALVVGSLIDPATIGNEHIRIHANEGRLFRTVIYDAVMRSAMKCRVVRERDLNGEASKALGRPAARIRALVTAAGDEVEGPWRAEQKSAAIAAWMQLGRR